LLCAPLDVFFVLPPTVLSPLYPMAPSMVSVVKLACTFVSDATFPTEQLIASLCTCSSNTVLQGCHLDMPMMDTALYALPFFLLARRTSFIFW
jgi:hypothetical protein